MIPVIGAGVAGLTAALALGKAGHEPHIYEAAHATADAGARALLQVNPAGQRAFAELDLGPQVAMAGFPVSAIVLSSEDGSLVGWFPAVGGDYRYIPRGQLLELLTSEIRRRGIPLSFDHALIEAAPGSPARVRFERNDSDDVELVVGADGAHSTVRRAVDPAARASYAGQWFVHGVSDISSASTEPRVVQVVRDTATGHAFGWTTLEDGPSHWWLRATAPPLVTTSSEAPPVDTLTGYVPPCCPGRHLIEASTGPLAVYNAYASDPEQRWVTDGIGLVGDAVHACSPAASWATALAAEDAVTLACALRDQPIARALELYQRLRRTRTTRAIAAGNPRRGISSGPDYPVSWDTEITPALAEKVHELYELAT